MKNKIEIVELLSGEIIYLWLDAKTEYTIKEITLAYILKKGLPDRSSDHISIVLTAVTQEPNTVFSFEKLTQMYYGSGQMLAIYNKHYQQEKSTQEQILQNTRRDNGHPIAGPNFNSGQNTSIYHQNQNNSSSTINIQNTTIPPTRHSTTFKEIQLSSQDGEKKGNIRKIKIKVYDSRSSKFIKPLLLRKEDDKYTMNDIKEAYKTHANLAHLQLEDILIKNSYHHELSPNTVFSFNQSCMNNYPNYLIIEVSPIPTKSNAFFESNNKIQSGFQGGKNLENAEKIKIKVYDFRSSKLIKLFLLRKEDDRYTMNDIKEAYKTHANLLHLQLADFLISYSCFMSKLSSDTVFSFNQLSCMKKYPNCLIIEVSPVPKNSLQDIHDPEITENQGPQRQLGQI